MNPLISVLIAFFSSVSAQSAFLAACKPNAKLITVGFTVDEGCKTSGNCLLAEDEVTKCREPTRAGDSVKIFAGVEAKKKVEAVAGDSGGVGKVDAVDATVANKLKPFYTVLSSVPAGKKEYDGINLDIGELTEPADITTFVAGLAAADKEKFALTMKAAKWNTLGGEINKQVGNIKYLFIDMDNGTTDLLIEPAAGFEVHLSYTPKPDANKKVGKYVGSKAQYKGYFTKEASPAEDSDFSADFKVCKK